MHDSFQQCLDRGAGEGLGERVGELRSSHQLHGIGRQQFACIEEGAQHVPGGPAAPDRGSFVITGVGGERVAHRVFRYVSHRESCGVAAGHQNGDRDEVLAVGLHGVRRGFTGLAIIQELREPVWERVSVGGLCSSAGGRGCGRRGRSGMVGHTSTVPEKRWIIYLIHRIRVTRCRTVPLPLHEFVAATP
jgi:hypothetical protein